MRKAAVALALAVAIVGSIGSAAFASSTSKGPYGSAPTSTVSDAGTCGNVWASDDTNSTYKVFGVNNDGSYNVTDKIAGKFTTIEGQAPGACGGDSNLAGDTIVNNVKGHFYNKFFISVIGGTFNSSATCNDSCGSFNQPDSSHPWSGIDNFVAAFFGSGASWSFSAAKDESGLYKSSNSALCENKWTATVNQQTFATDSSSGDIATHCGP